MKYKKTLAVLTLNDVEVNLHLPCNRLPCPPDPETIISFVDRLGQNRMSITLAPAPLLAEGQTPSGVVQPQNAVVYVILGAWL